MSAENIEATIVTAMKADLGALTIPGSFLGNRIYAQLSYWVDNLESGSTVKIHRLPPHAMVLAFLIRHAAMTNAVTAMIGDATDPDRWVETGGVTTMAAAGQQIITPRAGDYTMTAGGVLTAGTVGWGYRTGSAWTDVILKTEAANMGGEVRVDHALLYHLLG